MKTFLFTDFDNTLMATEQFAVPSLIARFNALYEAQIGAPLTFEDFKKHFHGQARETLCANLARHFGITVDCGLLYERREERMMEHLKSVPGGIPMAPHLIEALEVLKKTGMVLSFVSNNPIQRALAAMRYAANGQGDQLAGFFGTRWFEAGSVQKPDPDVYVRAMDQVGAAPEQSIAVEDSVSGAKSALAAGLETYAFTGFSDTATGEALVKLGCKARFNDWKDLPGLILG